ncbi:PTS transporter subunit EIIC [Ignavigranum ruoffiae]|uniref:PTS system IIB component, Glc family /PTS system IIC component, Glc family n=1 Tax=Ignavigranum ruoffiae TaxID=89093 RepID=A0A1H9CIT3_9LACT|nr:PTS transporter subunit EIIC [Ignavigranum ruoffiae]SEQ00971.1 PTS system IIB component, Glc family /PTS system IIC component, Glc family [Ignavigranum ruoffiae]
MKTKIMDNLQKFSRAMFIPVLILPIAGLLIAIGNIFTNERLINAVPLLNNPFTMGFGSVLSSSLLPVLTNLGLIFCVGIALGLANRKKAEAAFTAVLSYLVFVFAMNKILELMGVLVDPEALRGSGQSIVLGVQILDMGVFLGIILGIVVAWIHNKYIDTEFNNAFQIYGGARFVFIVLIPILIGLAGLFSLLWPIIQNGINALGIFIQHSGNFGLFIYGMLERLLIPTGLHHLVYTPFLYSSLGGTQEIAGVVYEGARNIYFAEITDPTIKVLSESVKWDARGISKMFGLIGACLAMYHTAKPENKVKAKAILIPAAFTSFIAGVTEPIEFSFMFVSPILYLIHSVLSGLSMVILNIFGSRAIGPNGFIDFLLYNLPLGIEKTNWPIYILVGMIFFGLYYVIFRILIIKMDLKTIGRSEEVKLYSKKEYQEAKSSMNEGQDSGVNMHNLVEGLGGIKNIRDVDNCYTRLRITVDNPEKVSKDVLQNNVNAKGVIINDQSVHVVYGLEVNRVRRDLDRYIEHNSGKEIDK